MQSQTLAYHAVTEEVGREMYSLITELYPICRSITGNGVRQTLSALRGHIPLEIHQVPSGTPVFDWVVPKEWNIRGAYVKSPKGEKILDFSDCNLHVLNYSVPVRKVVSLKELREHLFTLPDRPEWIPYKTSYYSENWGFCLSHHQFERLEEGDYEVCIDSSLENGHLSFGECLLPGDKEDEVLISCHVCHPSLANDNLSGISLATMLARALDSVARRYSYRFLFIPGTIGAITWLALNRDRVNLIRHGMVVTGVGDPGILTYKKSRRGNVEIDRAVLKVLRDSGQPHEVRDFHPYGYDERQYCSPGFDLPVGRLSRTPYGEYPQYHTSADNLDFVQPAALGGAFSMLKEVVFLLEENHSYLSSNQHCEPQLGKRGLYEAVGDRELAMLWVLNLSDGSNSLLDIAERSGLSFAKIADAARLLANHSLLTSSDRDALGPSSQLSRGEP